MYKLINSFSRIILISVTLMVGTFAQADIVAHKNVHIIVVLADNANQGIVPVPETLGDGMTPRTNLYWGALYGVKSYFRRQDAITTIKSASHTPPENVLEQLDFILQTDSGPVTIHAEAWRGDKMNAAIRNFYQTINSKGGPDLVVFVGHNGLMDSIVSAPINGARRPKLGANKDAMVLACLSDKYFTPIIKDLGATPVLMASGLMAPEAYSLLPAIKAWAEGKSANDIRKSAAAGYAKYQKIPVRNAEWLFGVTH